MRYCAVIFDLDGTLLDSLNDLATSMNQVLRRMGFPEHHPEAYKFFAGDGIEKLARRALPQEHRQNDEIGMAAAAAMREEYRRNMHNQTRPYPGIMELLGVLSVMQIQLGILTNKPDNLTRKVVTTYFPDIYFTAVAGAIPNRPLKPHPAGALALAQEFALPPASIVFVGDTGTDMKTATMAGMHPAGALWGFRTREELQAAGAQTLLQKPSDLHHLFT